MGKKLLFIYNPKAGKAQIKSKLADILDIFAEAEYEITVVPTRKRDDARLATAGRSKKYVCGLQRWGRYSGRGCHRNDAERVQDAHRLYSGGQH